MVSKSNDSMASGADYRGRRLCHVFNYHRHLGPTSRKTRLHASEQIFPYFMGSVTISMKRACKIWSQAETKTAAVCKQLEMVLASFKWRMNDDHCRLCSRLPRRPHPLNIRSRASRCVLSNTDNCMSLVYPCFNYTLCTHSRPDVIHRPASELAQACRRQRPRCS